MTEYPRDDRISAIIQKSDNIVTREEGSNKYNNDKNPQKSRKNILRR
jgi:hypothetical protein